jgi:hypothetical protein
LLALLLMGMSAIAGTSKRHAHSGLAIAHAVSIANSAASPVDHQSARHSTSPERSFDNIAQCSLDSDMDDEPTLPATADLQLDHVLSDAPVGAAFPLLLTPVSLEPRPPDAA